MRTTFVSTLRSFRHLTSSALLASERNRNSQRAAWHARRVRYL